MNILAQKEINFSQNQFLIISSSNHGFISLLQSFTIITATCALHKFFHQTMVQIGFFFFPLVPLSLEEQEEKKIGRKCGISPLTKKKRNLYATFIR